LKKKALITGITGQDDAYLTELLLEKGYEVHGIKRKSSNLIRIIQEVKPDEIYNLTAMSNVHVSFETPEYTANVDGLGTLIKEVVGYGGDFIFNTEKPDGTMRKVTDVSKLHTLNWKYTVELKEGIEKMYDWYLNINN